jgi:putative membrane protein
MSRLHEEHAQQPKSFWRNGPHQIMFWTYLVFWIWAAINPAYRQDWVIENLLIWATAIAMVGTYRWFKFSNFSYLLLTVFLVLHTLGAHYSYYVPLPGWLSNLLGAPGRWNYDRIVHWSYGLLLAYPVWEIMCRVVRVKGFWSYFLTVMVILATGAFYELLEMWVALIVAPELKDAFVGTQGDIWDAQKDMANALYGAIVVMVVTASVRWAGRKRKVA